jgi:anti-sigma-K factor RskA
MTIDRKDIPAMADDYVLGLLDAPSAEEVEQEIDRDPVLKAAVAASRERFLPLDVAAAPADVDNAMWDRIAAVLPDQDNRAAPRAHPRASNDNARNWWRITAISAVAATLLLSVGLTQALMSRAEPLVIAVLLDDRGSVQAVVEDFGDRNVRIKLLERFDVPAGKTIQAWTLPSPEMGPVSIGLLEQGHSESLEIPVLPQPHADQLYELTLEDDGGSPTGRPTGKILAKGFAKLPI